MKLFCGLKLLRRLRAETVIWQALYAMLDNGYHKTISHVVSFDLQLEGG